MNPSPGKRLFHRTGIAALILLFVWWVPWRRVYFEDGMRVSLKGVGVDGAVTFVVKGSSGAPLSGVDVMVETTSGTDGSGITDEHGMVVCPVAEPEIVSVRIDQRRIGTQRECRPWLLPSPARATSNWPVASCLTQPAWRRRVTTSSVSIGLAPVRAASWREFGKPSPGSMAPERSVATIRSKHSSGDGWVRLPMFRNMGERRMKPADPGSRGADNLRMFMVMNGVLWRVFVRRFAGCALPDSTFSSDRGEE